MIWTRIMRSSESESGRSGNLLRRHAFLLGLSGILCLCGCSEDRTTVSPAGREGAARLSGSETICPACEVVLEREAMIGGDPEDPVSIRGDAMFRGCPIGQLRHEGYVVGGVVGGGRVAVYDTVGELIRTIGREGEGPAEFGNDLEVAVQGRDSVYVVDYSNQRVVSLTPKGKVLGTFRLWRRPQSFTLLDGGRLLVHYPPLGTDGERLFWLYDASGDTLAAFGRPSSDLGPIDLDLWTVSPARPDGFWAARMLRYELRRWSGPDSSRYTLVREAEWFPIDQDLSQQRIDDMYEEVRPLSQLWHVWEDQFGRIWTYAHVPDADWKPAALSEYPPEWTRRHFDTMIEVLDLSERGRPEVVTRRRVDRMLAPVCGTPLVFRVLQDEQGHTRAEILRPLLRRGAGPDSGTDLEPVPSPSGDTSDDGA